MSQSALVFLPGDIFGIIALILISFTSVFMLVRKMVLKYTKNLDLLRRVHIYAATLGGLFLILHVAYFISYPVTMAVILGYISAAVAGVVWITGTAFLERFRDSLFYHGTLSLAGISLMVIHSSASGINIPAYFAYAVLIAAVAVTLYKAAHHTDRLLKAGGLVKT